MPVAAEAEGKPLSATGEVSLAPGSTLKFIVDGATYTDTTLTVTIDLNLNQGDANLSGGTDVVDFNIWNTNKFTNGTDWGSGDFNGDGTTSPSTPCPFKTRISAFQSTRTS